MSYVIEFRRVAHAYSARSSLASAWTDDHDDTASDAWSALEALVTDGSVAGATLAGAIFFRAAWGAETYRISLGRDGRVVGVEVVS